MTSVRSDVKHDRGFSLGAVITGLAVAIGSMFVLSALIGAVAVGTVDEQAVTPVQIGWGLGIALILTQFLAYLWGGYTAGRMAWGSGFLHGLLVPVAALVIGLIVGLIATAFGTQVNIPAAFGQLRFPVEQDVLFQIGLPIGIASLLAMFGGAIWGGLLGAGWHRKREVEVTEPHPERRAA